MGGAGVDPPSCKTGTFFVRSLALSEPIYRHFQSNECKSQTQSQTSKKNLYNRVLHKFFYNIPWEPKVYII